MSFERRTESIGSHGPGKAVIVFEGVDPNVPGIQETDSFTPVAERAPVTSDDAISQGGVEANQSIGVVGQEVTLARL